MKNITPHPIILYDGVCGLCDRFVQFVIKRDSLAKIKFAALQSEFAKQLLREFDMSEAPLSFVVLVEGEKSYIKSAAVLRALNHIGGPWRLIALLRVIPATLSDFVYDRIARSRYKLFGKYDQCTIPSPETRNRFLS